jgi:transketolase
MAPQIRSRRDNSDASIAAGATIRISQPPEITARVSIEAGSTFGWTRWIGERGVAIGLDRFGGSAPAETLYDKLGFSRERIVRAVRSLVNDSVLASR